MTIIEYDSRFDGLCLGSTYEEKYDNRLHDEQVSLDRVPKIELAQEDLDVLLVTGAVILNPSKEPTLLKLVP